MGTLKLTLSKCEQLPKSCTLHRINCLLTTKCRLDADLITAVQIGRRLCPLSIIGLGERVRNTKVCGDKIGVASPGARNGARPSAKTKAISLYEKFGHNACVMLAFWHPAMVAREKLGHERRDNFRYPAYAATFKSRCTSHPRMRTCTKAVAGWPVHSLRRPISFK